MISLLKKFFEVDFFLSNLLVPGIALALYCVSFAYISSLFLLEGVNPAFASQLGKYVLFVTAFMSVLAVFIINKAKTGGNIVFKCTKEKFYPGDFILLLLPLTPVVQYIVNNQGILSSLEIFYLLVIFILFSGFYIFIIPVLFRTVISTRTLIVLGLAFTYTIVSMASLSKYFNWFEKGPLRIQLIFFGGVFLIVWLVYHFNMRKVLYLFIVINFTVNSSTQLFSQINKAGKSPVSITENALLSLVEAETPAATPNIYLLVYDAYVPNETMLAYGLDNRAQENYLSKLGFKLYPHTYSVASSTLESMSRVLNASNEHYGNNRRGVSGGGITQTLLKEIGYETYGLFYSDFMFRGFGESYDHSIPERISPPYTQLLKAVFIGEFRHDIEGVGFGEQSRREFVKAKQTVFKNVSGKQVFVYTHSNLPSHSQNSGACLADETARFEQRLTRSNSEMRQDINLIIQNDPGAIVIVAGDHGPYLTKNCNITTDVYDLSEISRLDIQDRHGTFLAIKWPTDDFVLYDDITILQDVFPAVFAYIYKDARILESKIAPVIPVPNTISGASVNNGIIYGGINDGEPLFLSEK